MDSSSKSEQSQKLTLLTVPLKSGLPDSHVILPVSKV